MTGLTSRRRAFARSATAAFTIGLVWVGCTQDRSDLTGPSDQTPAFQDLFASAIAAQDRHTERLIAMPEVVGTGVGLGEDGRPVVRIFTMQPGVTGLPRKLEGIPVEVKFTGMFVALTDPTVKQPRPVPIGVSTGHPNITAGTIGARVKDGAGNVYALSNNHVYADANDASIGDGVIQPGTFDGGSDPADRIGTLADFEPLDFSMGGSNVIDAAIAISSVSDLDYTTPVDDGYGAPGTSIGAPYVGQPVMKYGRTTGLTQGTVTEINVSVSVCYEVMIIFCTKSAYFVNQIGIGQAGFSGGGDSGSLIVTNDALKKPVGLLFAGSETSTLANPIAEVLARFSVTIDGGDGDPPPPPPPPPPPGTPDIAIDDVSAPTSAQEGDVVTVDVTVSNVGDEDAGTDIVVTLTDETDGGPIGSQPISGGLTTGEQATLSYSWDTQGASIGDHTLTASHDYPDENPGNDSNSTVVTVESAAPPPGTIHNGDLDGMRSSEGTTWTAYVIARAEDEQHNPVAGVTIWGKWKGGGIGSDECVTDYAGECLFVDTLISRRRRRVTFTVTDIESNTMTYVAEDNHDFESDSNGTKITIRRP